MTRATRSKSLFRWERREVYGPVDVVSVYDDNIIPYVAHAPAPPVQELSHGYLPSYTILVLPC